MRRFHYVRSSAVNKDAQEGRHVGSPVKSGINQGAAQRFGGEKVKGYKIQSNLRRSQSG